MVVVGVVTGAAPPAAADVVLPGAVTVGVAAGAVGLIGFIGVPSVGIDAGRTLSDEHAANVRSEVTQSAFDFMFRLSTKQ